MLSTPGQNTTTAVSGLTAFSLLEVGGLLTLPVFVLPTIIAGTPIAEIRPSGLHLFLPPVKIDYEHQPAVRPAVAVRRADLRQS